uniref:Uncharacterized protein n=1 Tax=Pithovirus LCPAC401 TaxID=2506595 RepID=A0A481ZBN1_9VIRU|nr:MAG: hypothetical protein LCPAC401_01780 [Pithovirus LCPAC401]
MGSQISKKTVEQIFVSKRRNPDIISDEQIKQFKRIHDPYRVLYISGNMEVYLVKNNTERKIFTNEITSIITSTEIIHNKRIKGFVKIGRIVSDDEKDTFNNKIAVTGDVLPQEERSWYTRYEIMLIRIGLIEDDPLDYFTALASKSAELSYKGRNINPSFTDGETINNMEWNKYEDIVEKMKEEFKSEIENGEFTMVSCLALLE